MKRTPFKPRSRPMKRKGRLHIKGHSTVSQLKEEIQSLLRQIVMKRDKKCILHGIRCNHEVGMEGIVWQAEHLIERSNSATYADPRLVVLVCRNCHGWKHFKKSNHDQYDAWVKTRLSKERVALWERCAADHSPTHKGSYDWKLHIIALKQELAAL